MGDNEEIETLTVLLKDKAKDIKALKKKLKKVEEKYVEVFKNNKMIVEDRKNLVKLLVESYNDPEIQNKLTFDDYGWYSYEDLKPILEEAKEKEHYMYKQMSDADLIPDMQKQIDIYKEEFKNYNDQMSEQKRVIGDMSAQIEELESQVESKNKEIKDLRNDNDHMRARLNSLQKTVQEQSEYIDDIKEVHEGKTKEKADEIMGQFQNILGFNGDDDESDKMKSKISGLQDENIMLKETIASLKREISQGGKESDNKTDGEEINSPEVEEVKKEDISQHSQYLDLMQEVTEYKTELEEKSKELKESLKKSEESESIIETLNVELLKNKNNAKEYIIKKEKEIERLKNKLKKYSSANGVGSPQNTSGSKEDKSHELSNEHTKSDISENFFNKSSESEPDLHKSKIFFRLSS